MHLQPQILVGALPVERDFFIDNLLVRVLCIIEMIGGPASHHGSLNPLYQEALHLPSSPPLQVGSAFNTQITSGLRKGLGMLGASRRLPLPFTPPPPFDPSFISLPFSLSVSL